MYDGEVKGKREFGRLFIDNYSRFFYCALDLVEDAETARDIVGDVTCDTWRIISSNANVKPEMNVVGYMLNAIRNRALNVLRHRAVENAYLSEALSAKQMAMTETADRHEERLKRVYEVIDGLDEQTQRIVRLCWFDGKKYKEVAEELGITVSLVHKKVSKTFATLRQSFGVKISVVSVTILIGLLLLL